MPKFSPTGLYALDTDALGCQAGTDWGWLNSNTAIGYRFDITPGLYTCKFPEKTFTYVGPGDWQVRRRFFASGNGGYLADLTTGGFDDQGVRFPDTLEPVGIGDNNEEIFVNKSDFASLTIRKQDMLDVSTWQVPAPGFVNFPATMRVGKLMWQSVTGPRDADGTLLGPNGAMQTFRDGWGVGYIAGWGLGIWKLGTTKGYCLSQDGRDYFPDVFVDGAQIRVLSAEGENDSGRRLYQIHIADGLWCGPDGVWKPLVEVDFAVPNIVVPDVPNLNHKVSIAPFKDPNGDTPADCEVVVNQAQQTKTRPCWVSVDSIGKTVGPVYGIYTEASDPETLKAHVALAASKGWRVAWCHDGTDLDLTLIKYLRPIDQPWLECYRTKSETLAQSRQRWSDNLNTLLSAWSGDVGIIPQDYNQGGVGADELWTVQETLDALAEIPSLINRSVRIVTAAPFEYLRGNGASAHPELKAWLFKLIAATPGVPTFYVGPLAPPTTGDTMPIPSSSFTCGFKVIGCFVGVSPRDPGPVYADRLALAAWERFKVTRNSDNSFSAVAVEANRQLTINEYGELETRAPGAIGSWERFSGAVLPDGSWVLWRGKTALMVVR